MYFVFERSDGYFGAINSSEKLREGELPQLLRPYTAGASGKRTTFVVLLQSDDWDECVKLLQRKRGVADEQSPAHDSVRPPIDPVERDRRLREDLVSALDSVRRALELVRADANEAHGGSSPVTSMIEIAIIATTDAGRFATEMEA